MLELCGLDDMNTQVIYLTATLPPLRQHVFFQVAGVQAENVYVCRAQSTTQRNLSYQVIDYERSKLNDTLTDLVRQIESKFRPDVQIIVFCPSVQ